MVYLYVHIVPNGKRYIGIANDYNDRWGLDGYGYRDNESFYKDIQFYGWSNIKHEIINIYEDREEAEKYEQLYIVLFNTENPKMGYNRTKIKEELIRTYKKRIDKTGEVYSRKYKKYSSKKREFLKKFNMPWTAICYMIDEWIFDEKERQILKRRIHDGISLNELGKEFSLSDTAIKSILKDGINELERHI